MGSLSFHPIFMTCANLHDEERQKDRAWRLIGLLPALAGTPAEKKKERFKNAKRAVFQACMAEVMKSFETASKEWVPSLQIWLSLLPFAEERKKMTKKSKFKKLTPYFPPRGLKIADFDGNFHAAFPFLGYIACDWPESKLYNLTMDGNKTDLPCGFCLCPKVSLHKLGSFFPLRTVQEMEYLVTQAGKMNKTKAAEFLKPYSLKPTTVFPSFGYITAYVGDISFTSSPRISFGSTATHTYSEYPICCITFTWASSRDIWGTLLTTWGRTGETRNWTNLIRHFLPSDSYREWRLGQMKPKFAVHRPLIRFIFLLFLFFILFFFG